MSEIKTPGGKVIRLSDWQEQSTYSSWRVSERHVHVWLTSDPNGTWLEIYQRRRRWCWPFRCYDFQRAWWLRRWSVELVVRWPVPPRWEPSMDLDDDR